MTELNFRVSPSKTDAFDYVEEIVKPADWGDETHPTPLAPQVKRNVNSFSRELLLSPISDTLNGRNASVMGLRRSSRLRPFRFLITCWASGGWRLSSPHASLFWVTSAWRSWTGFIRSRLHCSATHHPSAITYPANTSFQKRTMQNPKWNPLIS